MVQNWERAERYVELLTGGRLTPGSGCGRVKGDVRVANSEEGAWMIEVKSTIHPTIRLQKEWLRKLEDHRHRASLALVMVTHSDVLIFAFQQCPPSKDTVHLESKSLVLASRNGLPCPRIVRISDYGEWHGWLPEELRYETRGK